MNSSSLEDRVAKIEAHQRRLTKVVMQILHHLGLKKKAHAEAPSPGTAAQQQQAGPPVPWFERDDHLRQLEQVQRAFDQMGEGEHVATLFAADGREVPVKSRRGRALWVG